jgi:hypothetical protein
MTINLGQVEYKISLLEAQVKALEQALNEARAKTGLPQIQMPKPVRGLSVHQQN